MAYHHSPGNEPGFRMLSMDINAVLFDGFTTPGFTGPPEALQRITEYSIRYFTSAAAPWGTAEALP